MIYILSGNDTKKKNAYLKKLCNGDLPIFVSPTDVSKAMLFDYAQSTTLFGIHPTIVVENIIEEEILDFSPEDLSSLKESQTTFVFIEDKLLMPDVKKYKKYTTIEDFSSTTKKIIKKNFDIAEAFSRKDKIGTWILYRKAISLGAVPEEISGIIFWKIKTMLLYGTKFFSPDELKNKSSELVSIYHRAHKGDCDFTIGLEQFILSSLSK